MEKGWLVMLMEKILGASWRTSLFGILAFLSEAANIIQQYLTDIKCPPGVLHTVSAIFALIAIMKAKDGQVTGGSIVQQPKPPDAPK